MGLKEYSKNRNLKKSGEPRAVVKKKKIDNKKKIFVVHSHYATHHHYDLRLEINNVLKSWAVPKSPPIEKGVKRLAIQVEDHPLGYASFNGEIKEGYGKGIVKIWDKGTYDLIEKNSKKIIVELKGKKLKGKYALVKTNYSSKPEKSWLWFKV